jgi:hypothetical protein
VTLENFYSRQTCLNGHVITSYVHSEWTNLQPFCSKCGAKTIIECPHCQAEQRGFNENVMRPDRAEPDSFCYNCGQPYPWTQSRLDAASLLIEENETLSPAEKLQLNSSLLDITSDTPKTEVAITRIKRLLPKAGTALAGTVRRLFVDIVSETVRKAIWE